MRHLFASRRFLPLFITQFLGASNDNLFKNALTILVVYRFAADDPAQAGALINWIAALFILPFLLFSASAGSLADSMDKARIARSAKLLELALVCLATAALWSGNIFFLLAVIFGFGAQSALFGPVKYALLPQQLQERELVAANGYIEAATFLAILLGTIIGGAVVLRTHGIPAIIALMGAAAGIGYIASRYIPPAPPKSPAAALSLNPWRQSIAILAHIRGRRDILACILAITWFWIAGIVALTQLPALTRQFLHADEYVTTFFLTLFSIGIGIGSILCQRLLHNNPRADIAPLGAMGMGLCLCLIHAATPPLQAAAPLAAELAGLGEFLQRESAPWLIGGFLGASICGGLYVVPLYAVMQQRAEPGHRARIIAGNNILNAAGMTLASLTVVALLHFGASVPQILLLLGVLCFAMALFCLRLLSVSPMTWLAMRAGKLLYRVEMRGRENFPAAGTGCVLVANHVSSIDALLLHCFLPRRGDLVFVHEGENPWPGWMRLLMREANTHHLNAEDSGGFENLRDALGGGGICVFFPEGAPGSSGALEKMAGSAALLADSADVALLPIRIEGAQYSRFSGLRNGTRKRLFAKTSLTVLPPQRLRLPEGGGRERGQLAASRLYDLMCEAMFAADVRRDTLLAELLKARRRHGGGAVILEDMQPRGAGEAGGTAPRKNGKITYGALIAKSFVLSRLLGRNLGGRGERGAAPPGKFEAEQRRIGVMLPNAIGAVVTFFALQILGRSVAMMNFSAGPAQIVSASRTAEVRTILTSKRFVSLAGLQPIVAALEADGIRVLHLEDLRKELRLGDKLTGLWALLLPESLLRASTGKTPSKTPQTAKKEAVVLFTSGSEGAPKGVVLSHDNVIANLQQLVIRVDFGPRDRIFSCLPMFHSFGLTAGTMLPLCRGVPTLLYPSPLHYAAIPDLIHRSGASLLFSTDTFLRGYARFAHAGDFQRLRLVFAGAEKLHEETRLLWSERFGVRVLQGYGVTETAPVISVNTPMENRHGSVGRPLPGVELRLESEADLQSGKRLYVRGANVMLGYLKEDAPGVLQPPEGGWHDTGDIVTLDAEGYLAIVDRFGRFAKIGGEMVSLGAVEAAVGKLWQDGRHVVVAVADASQGESLVLLTQQQDADVHALGEHFRRLGLARLWIPRRIFCVSEAPLLPSGKADYVKARALALELTRAQETPKS